MRDDLPTIAAYLDEIAAIESLERHEISEGRMRVVNRWEAAPQLPSVLMPYARPEMLCWIDHAVWEEREGRCEWSITSDFFGDHVSCAGATEFFPAMGGRGVRVTFAGSMTLHSMPRGFEHIPSLLSHGAEAVVSRMVSSNFQKLTRAIELHLANKQ
jgi:hypothetical protein